MPFEIVRKDLSEVTADAVVRFVNTGTGVRVLHRGSLPPGMAKELEFVFTPRSAVVIEVTLPQSGVVIGASLSAGADGGGPGTLRIGGHRVAEDELARDIGR